MAVVNKNGGKTNVTPGVKGFQPSTSGKTPPQSSPPRKTAPRKARRKTHAPQQKPDSYFKEQLALVPRGYLCDKELAAWVVKQPFSTLAESGFPEYVQRLTLKNTLTQLDYLQGFNYYGREDNTRALATKMLETATDQYNAFAAAPWYGGDVYTPERAEELAAMLDTVRDMDNWTLNDEGAWLCGYGQGYYGELEVETVTLNDPTVVLDVYDQVSGYLTKVVRELYQGDAPRDG